MKSNFNQKLVTMTALAAACSLLFTAPAISATPDTAVTTSVPSAVDSSKRVVRLSQSGAVASTTQAGTPATPASVLAPSTISQISAVSQPMNMNGIDISRGQLPNIPVPQTNVANISFITTVMIPKTQGSSNDLLDVSMMDDFIEDVSPNARHYPPNFPNRSQRYYTREQIKVLADMIDPYASAPNASYEILIRAAKLNGMGRNLDLGTDYVVRAGKYIDRAIKAQPSSGEANFLYGMMLAEGGGFKEGEKYLDIAAGLGYTEAEQSLAQSDILSDRRSQALERLRNLERRMPNDTLIRQQIKIIEDGGYYIWNIPAPDIDVQPPAIAQNTI